MGSTSYSHRPKNLSDRRLDIVVAGTKHAVTMVEGEAKEVSEKDNGRRAGSRA